MKTLDEIREGYVSMAQQRAVWATRKDGGKGHPDNKKKSKKEDTSVDEASCGSYDSKKKTKEDSDAVKAFLAKGGKIKKLPAAKAQGYHGKDDPGKGMHGMMDKPDTKAMGTRKKVKSMEATQVAEMQIYRVGHKSVGGNVHARDTDHAMEILRNKGVKGKISLTHKGAVKDRIRNSKTGKPMAYAANEATQVDEISKDTKKSYIKKAADDMSKQADRMARAQRGDGTMAKAANKFVNRRKGIARAVENYQVQKYTDGKKDGPAKSFGGNLKKATAHASKMGKDHRVHKEASETDPPFDDAKKISTTPTKDQFGNVIKNRAKSLARAAAKKAGGDMGDKQKKESLWDNIRKRRAAGKPKLKPGDKNYPKTLNIGEEAVNELDQKTMNSYHAKAQKSKDKATNSAVATILRKGDHSKDLKTMSKREKGMKMAKSRTIKKIRGDK